MNQKRIKHFFIFHLLIILVIGASCTTNSQNSFVPRDPMPLDEIEYSFIHMDEYLPISVVEKSDQPFIFPRKENIILPQSFINNGNTYNTQHYLDSSDTQGFLVIDRKSVV